MNNLSKKYLKILMSITIGSTIHAESIVLKDGITGKIILTDTSGTHVSFKRNDKMIKLNKKNIKYIITGCDTIDYTIATSPVVRPCSGAATITNKKRQILNTIEKWPLRHRGIGDYNLLIYDKPLMKDEIYPLYDTLNNYMLNNTESRLISFEQLDNHLASNDDAVIVLAVSYSYQRNTIQSINPIGGNPADGFGGGAYNSKYAAYTGKIRYLIINPHHKIRILDEELTEENTIPFGVLGTIYAKESKDTIQKKAMLKIVEKLVTKINKLH